MKWRTAPALAVSLAIVNLAAQSSPAKGQAKSLSVANETIPDCGTPTASWTIRLHVPSGWGPVHPGRHVRHQDSGQGGDDLHETKYPLLDKDEKNPFHIDVRHLPTGYPPSELYAKVRIILLDPDAHFAEWDVGKTHIKWVGTIGNSTDKMLCSLSKEKLGNREIVTFYIHMNPKSAGEIERAFSFGFVGDGPQTPVLIDPSVKNYG